jgi:hypothetical protein
MSSSKKIDLLRDFAAGFGSESVKSGCGSGIFMQNDPIHYTKSDLKFYGLSKKLYIIPKISDFA